MHRVQGRHGRGWGVHRLPVSENASFGHRSPSLVDHPRKCRFSDPARFSFALGGKDRHPFPVPLKTYDESISVLRRALDAAKLGDTDKIDGFKRLDRFVKAIERKHAPEANFDAVVTHESAISPQLDGRSVFDKAGKAGRARQLRLFP